MITIGAAIESGAYGDELPTPYEKAIDTWGAEAMGFVTAAQSPALFQRAGNLFLEGLELQDGRSSLVLSNLFRQGIGVERNLELAISHLRSDTNLQKGSREFYLYLAQALATRAVGTFSDLLATVEPDTVPNQRAVTFAALFLNGRNDADRISDLYDHSSKQFRVIASFALGSFFFKKMWETARHSELAEHRSILEEHLFLKNPVAWSVDRSDLNELIRQIFFHADLPSKWAEGDVSLWKIKQAFKAMQFNDLEQIVKSPDPLSNRFFMVFVLDFCREMDVVTYNFKAALMDVFMLYGIDAKWMCEIVAYNIATQPTESVP